MDAVTLALSGGVARGCGRGGGQGARSGRRGRCTATSLLGGLAPVPGGMGVMEASFISGLTLAGVPEGPAIAATFIYRMVTAYLPPIWGWVAMLWLRHTDAL